MANQEIEGLSVRADMEGASLKQGLQQLNAQLKSVRSEFNLAQSGVEGFSDSLDGMRAKSSNLERQINVQSQIVDNLRQAYERSQTAVSNTVNKQNELRQAMSGNRTQYEEAIRLHGEESEEAKNLANAYQVLERQYAQNQTALSRNNTAMANSQTRLNNAQASLRNMETQLEDTNVAIARQANEWQQLSDSLTESANQINIVGERMTNLGESVTKRVTVPLTALGAAAIAAFKDVDTAVDSIATATGATGDNLEELKGNLSNVAGTVSGDLNEMGKALGEVNTRFKFTGEQLEETTESFIKFARINGTDTTESVRLVARYMGDAGISGENYKKVLDQITKAAQDTGISVSSLLETSVKYGAPMRSLGLEMEESISLLSAWEQAGVNTEIAFSGMKQAIGAWGRSGKDATVEFKKTLDEIKKAPTIADATTKSIEAFGQEAGPDLADAIKGGRFEYEALLETIKASNGTLDGTFGAVTDEMDGYNIALNKSKLALAELGNEILISAAPVIEDLTKLVQDCGEWFSSLDDDTKQGIVRFGMMAAAVGPFSYALGKIISVGGAVTRTIGSISSKIAGAGGLKAALSSIPTVASGAVLALTAITTALTLWKHSADEAREAQERALEEAKAYTETAKSIENLKEQYKQVNQLTDDDKTKKEQLKSIQEQLINTYGVEAQGIDIVNGKYEEQLNLLNGIKDRKREDAEIAYSQEVINAQEKLDNLTKYDVFMASGNNMGGSYEEWKNAINGVSEEYKDLVKGIDIFNSSGIQMNFDTRNPEKYKELLSEIILNAREYGLESSGLYNDIYKSWGDLSTALEDYSEAQQQVFSFDFSNQLSDIKEGLGLGEVTQYTEEQAEKIKAAFTESIKDSDEEYQEFANNMLNSLPVVGKAIEENMNVDEKVGDAAEGLTEILDELSSAIEGAGKITGTFSADLETLEKAIEKVKNGGKLSGEEIVALKDKYSELNVKINESTGERYIELSALEKLKAELPNLSKAQIESEKARTEAAIKSAKERMKIYLEEQKVLNGLVSYNSESGNLDWGNMPDNVKDNILSSNPHIKEQYNQAMAEAQKVKDLEGALAEFDKAIDNIDIIGSTRGSSGSGGSSGSSESPLDAALKSFEKSKKVRAVGLDEEMAQLETIKAAYAKSAEDKVDIEEYMYKNYLDIIERKRSLGQLSQSEEIRMYEVALEKYTYNEYQKAEMSAKLLDTKVENSKAWIEQEKYYGRMSLEEEMAAYKRIEEYSKQSTEYKKEMAKEVYRVEKELKEQQEELEKEKREAVKNTVESNIKAKEDEYNKTIAMIDEECDRKVSAYQEQIDALQEQYDKEEELEKQKEYDDKIADLEERMKHARTQEEFEKLAEELNNTQQAKRDYTRQQQLKSDKSLLEDKISQAKKEAEIAKDIEKEKLDAYKETQNKMLEESTTVETSITEMLKQQLAERDNAFINSLKAQLTAAGSFKTAMGALVLGGMVGMTGGVSGAILASASNKLQNNTANNNYAKSTYNNQTTNANMQVTNIIKNQADVNAMMGSFGAYIKKLNRSKGVT